MSNRGLRDQRRSTPPCPSREALPSPPRIEVELLRELSRSPEGFLRVRAVELRNRYEDGVLSEPYRYFMVERSRLDAVAIVLYRKSKVGLELVLRSQLRPPLAFRGEYEVPLPETEADAVQWEIPAGLVEPGERGQAGLYARASAESLEEVGVILPPERFRTLGAAPSLSPGVMAEKIHFVCAEILDTDEWQRADGDGHVVESHSVSVFVSVAAALEAVEQGLVHDIKTEVGIRRLLAISDALAGAAPLAADAEREQA